MPDILPDLIIEQTQSGVEKAREHANALFSKGSVEEASRWFSKCLWLIESGQVSGSKEWNEEQRTALHSNRAFAYIKLGRFEEAESDCSSTLSLSPTRVKALYRRAQARLELGRLEGALEDVEAALRQQSDSQELKELRDRIAEKQNKKSKPAAVPQRLEEVSSSPTTSPKSSPSSRKSPSGMGPAARAAAAVRAAPAPSVPKQSPKNSVELLRHFHSMQKHPAVLATYIRERVPPSLVQSIFARSPIEPDDLATLLTAVRTNTQEADQADTAGEYLHCLLKTNSADIQFGMLSDAEKEIVRSLLASLSADGARTKALQASFKKVLA